MMSPILTLPFMKKRSLQEEKPPGADELELQVKLCKLIINRHREEIERLEERSVADLKNIVLPHDETILQIKGSITGAFHPYIYEEHFSHAAKMAFSYVSSFKTISLPVSFWLSFSEMRELMAGDEIDKCSLFCSILRSLGSDNAKIFVTEGKKSYVLLQFSGKTFVADWSQKELLEAPSAIEAFSHLAGKPLYSFNDKEYDDFSTETE